MPADEQQGIQPTEDRPPPPRSKSSSNMPFLDHLEELRWRILKILGAILVAAIACFAFSAPIMRPLTRP